MEPNIKSFPCAKNVGNMGALSLAKELKKNIFEDSNNSN